MSLFRSFPTKLPDTDVEKDAARVVGRRFWAVAAGFGQEQDPTILYETNVNEALRSAAGGRRRLLGKNEKKIEKVQFLKLIISRDTPKIK